MDEKQKLAVVTGASRNIGRAICRKFVVNGYQIIGVCSPFDSIDIKSFKNEFPDSVLFETDFCDPIQVANLVNQLKQYNIDVIVNNAGMLNLDKNNNVVNEFNDFEYDSFYRVFQCNFFAPLRLCLELKDCINHNGCIINIASGAGLKAAYATLSYNASKAALINLSASLSNSFYPYRKVRVNSISPGWVMPDSSGGMNMSNDSPGYKAMHLTPLERNGTTEDIANVVWALCQPEMEFINGANIPVDGGFCNHDVIYYEEATGQSIVCF